MARLDTERQKELEPKRLKTALQSFKEIGLKVISSDHQTIRFLWKSSPITFYVYSGWASGRTIKDGRGLKNLLKQLSKEGI